MISIEERKNEDGYYLRICQPEGDIICDIRVTNSKQARALNQEIQNQKQVESSFQYKHETLDEVKAITKIADAVTQIQKSQTVQFERLVKLENQLAAQQQFNFAINEKLTKVINHLIGFTI